uniref:Acyltransferase n=1 Tax=Globodera rostochiensis TaxID=31243 RepID=A0A914GWW5_GLORO
MFCPIYPNLDHLLQLLAVYHHIFLWIGLPVLSVSLPFYIFFFTRFWWAVVVYFVWFLYDFDTPRRGSRNWAWYKNATIWKHFSDYFPIRLVKTVELSPNRNYILGCHPHGVFSVGAFVHLCTSATGFGQLFPGLKSNILTLNGQFWFPFRREIGIGLGGVESSSRSLKFLLSNPGRGRLIGIVIGGAEEVLDAHPGQHHLNILGRRGFCRFALKTGTSLLPSYSFGENDLFDQYPNSRGSRLRTIQSSIKRKCGFCIPFINGCCGFCDHFGLLPRRRPITTVIGAPIEVKRIGKPTPDQVELLHSHYCNELDKLFEEHKTKYGVPNDVHLTFH